MSDEKLMTLATEMIQTHVPTGTYDDRWLSGLTDGPFPNVPESITVTFEPYTPEQAALIRGDGDCRVYWGSHGCQFERDHKQPCRCDCCGDDCAPEHIGCAGSPPYYGPETVFYGGDAASRGLPRDDEDGVEP